MCPDKTVKGNVLLIGVVLYILILYLARIGHGVLIKGDILFSEVNVQIHL